MIKCNVTDTLSTLSKATVQLERGRRMSCVTHFYSVALGCFDETKHDESIFKHTTPGNWEPIWGIPIHY